MSNDPVSQPLQTLTSKDDRTVLKLNQFLPYRLVHLAETVSRSFSQIYADQYGIGIPEWRLLATLGEHEAMTARDIGTATSMHKTKVSRAVAALETRGFVEREKNPDDLREQMLKLSAKGSEVYSELVPKALAYSKELEDALTDEQNGALSEIFERLNKAASNFHPE
ncbi:MAG: MarR family transcriptional regulator [Pseudomonadota bacterium]